MKTLIIIFQNSYFRCLLILCIVHVLTRSFGFPLNRFDYIFVVYAFTLPLITFESALKYALIFGLFYDLDYSSFIGVGILLFQVLNFLKVQVYITLDMNKAYSRFLFLLFTNIFYTFVTLKVFSYSGYSFLYSLFYYVCTNIVAILAVKLFLGGKRALSKA